MTSILGTLWFVLLVAGVSFVAGYVCKPHVDKFLGR